MKDDPVWLSPLLFGPLVWMVLFAAFVNWSSLDSIGLWIGNSFTLNVAAVSVAVPWLERLYGRK